MPEKVESSADAYYRMDAAETLKRTGSSEKGISDQEASKRLEQGFNELREKPRKTSLQRFFDQFDDILIKILIVAAIVSAALGFEYSSVFPFVKGLHSVEEIYDAIAIMVIVLLNAAFGYWQEAKAEKAIEALKKMLAPVARVVRNGEEKKIPARELVPGDVVILEAGDRVPADCRILVLKDLEVQEAALTGESLPVKKQAEPLAKQQAVLGDQKNMLFMSSTLTRGHCRAVVVATGMNTQIGKISEMVQSQPDEETRLQKRLEQVGRGLGYGAPAITVLLFGVGLLQGREAVEMFLVSVSLAVAAIPEGLPAVVTITMAFGVQRMAKRNAIIRKLPAVETLGSATVICSDKTGTLTKNEMTVRRLFVGEKFFEVTGKGYEKEGQLKDGGKAIASPLKDAAFSVIGLASGLCNNAKLVRDVSGKSRDVAGDPTEGSLLVLAEKIGYESEDLREEMPRLDEVPFDSERKMMSTLHRRGKEHVMLSKGAPEILLKKCSEILDKGKERKITDADRKKILAANKEMAGDALRVLGVAYRKFAAKPAKFDEKAEAGLGVAGLGGMNDPPREEAKDAIEKCKKAGIKVVMITGDNEITAAAIARELRLIESGDERVITGAQLEEMNDADLDKMVEKIAIYARVNPEHKMRIVNSLKKNGHVVAMTGDGVNDAPALKRADIGIAMGIAGTDVAKEASAMVLADDNFASIVSAVEEGRIIFDNIMKAVRYLLSCNIGEVVTIFTALVTNLPLPLLPLQILWMNLVTDGMPALALGTDPADEGIMERKPKPKDSPVFSKGQIIRLAAVGIIVAAGTLGMFYWVLGVEGGAESEFAVRRAQTIAFTTIIFFQLFHAINNRSDRHSLFKIGFFKNRFLIGAVGLAAVLQMVVVYWAPAQAVFQTVEPAWWEMAAALVVASSILWITEWRKAVWNRLRVVD